MIHAEVEYLSPLLTPEVLGILWSRPKGQKERSLHFHLLDYYFDGLLTKQHQLFPAETHEGIRLYSTYHFNRPFYLLECAEDTSVEELKKNLDLLGKEVALAKRVLILSESSKTKEQILKDLQRKVLPFEFF